MINKLKNLVDSTNPRVFGQVLTSKRNKDLYDWVIDQSAELQNGTLKGRVKYILEGKPPLDCKHGNKKKMNQKGTKIGYCGSTADCQCFRDQITELGKQNDMTNVVSKRKKTWLKKYGVDNVSKNETVKTKRKKTMESRNYNELRERLQFEKETEGFYQVIDRIKDSVTPEFTREEYKGCFRKNRYRWKCNLCGLIFDDHVDYGHIPKCVKCYPKEVSKGEIEIRQFLEELGIQFETNTKKILGNLEYDIFIPKYNIAIEFNGSYWHSSEFKPKNYHAEKFIKSRNLGIRLIQIFEDEWKTKSDIIKSRLRNLFGTNNRIYARKCSVQPISHAEYKDFVEKTHLQGYAQSSIRYGLVYNLQLVAVMSFGKSRYTDDGYELIRYCSIGNVVGGAGKLFKHFVKIHSPLKVISYANRSWSNGKLYEKLGFMNTTRHDLNTDYWYVKGHVRFHRSTFQKARLVAAGADPNLTEEEIMLQSGYMKIYGCGNYRFEWSPVQKSGFTAI